MIRRSFFLLLLVFVSACGGGSTADPGPETPRSSLCAPRGGGSADGALTLPWPSADHPTLQALIDAAPAGATIIIEPGIHDVADPILVEHKVDLSIVGGGSSLDEPAMLTQLEGASPVPVLVEYDDDGQDNVVAPAADEVLGMFTCLGSSVSIRSMRLSGWDAGIVTRDQDGVPTALCAENLSITGTGRGVLVLGTGGATLRDCEISDTSWNAVSASPRFAGPVTFFPVIDVSRLSLTDPIGAGMYFANTFAVVDGATILRAGNGGIVTYRCFDTVTNCTIVNCAKAGVLLFESLRASEVVGCWIVGTRSLPGNLLGDGIALFSSEASLRDNTINGPARAGVSLFGRQAWLRDNTITCASFSLVSAAFDGRAATLNDLGGNRCGCGGGLTSCNRQSGGPEPPAAVGGLE